MGVIMNRMMGALAVVFLHATCVVAAPGHVRLSGTVTKTGAGPLKDVAISIRSASNISTTSGADGKFLLAAGSSGIANSIGLDAIEFRVTDKSLRIFSERSDLHGRLEVLSANGKALQSREFDAASNASVSLESFGQGLNLVRLTTGNRTALRSVLRLDQTLFVNGDVPAATNDIGAARAAATIDTLVLKKTGFVDKLVPLSAYVDSNLSIAMDSLTTCPAPKAGTSKSNPIFTDLYSADPGVMVDNCTFYIQAGHDEGTGGFVMREWFLYKSTDMVTWTRTTPMTLKIFAWTNANAWAGQMIKARNGKYYWYVPINDIKFSKDRMAIGVAVADKPEGPWKDALGKPIVNDSVEMAVFGGTNIDQTPHTIDPTVFIDDDGQAYLQYGGFWTMVSVKLNPDMISLGSKLVKATPLDYFESPYLIKRNGLYYQIYARGSANPTTIDYATSTNPQGPWTWRGQILGKMPKVAGQDETTNHAGVAEFAGQWYIVYHVSNGPNGGGTYKRMVAIDKMFFNADGTIKPVTPSAALSF
jgi:hypothetical protein